MLVLAAILLLSDGNRKPKRTIPDNTRVPQIKQGKDLCGDGFPLDGLRTPDPRPAFQRLQKLSAFSR